MSAVRPVAGVSPSGDRPGCPARYHGTASAYQRHGCRCADSREAHRLYCKRRREGRGRVGPVDPTGTVRRLQALFALGWPAARLAADLGVSHGRILQYARQRTILPATAAAVANLYDRLSMTPGPSACTRGRARQLGYLPPLAWETADIDDPASLPSLDADDAAREAEVDWVVVEMACSGRRRGPLTPADRAAAVAELVGRGFTDAQVGVRLHVSYTVVKQVRTGLGLPANTEPAPGRKAAA